MNITDEQKEKLEKIVFDNNEKILDAIRKIQEELGCTSAEAIQVFRSIIFNKLEIRIK
jgi:hypothetical protein